ncbi:FbpB family small basic protein [Bacillus sp. V3B]|nr:FbpB family small basic protein [Bacillus sp. V3B]MCQ6275538.1 FbpB family small basic protein [Bacillus sp. V3B]
MRKQKLNMQTLINANRKEILSSKAEMERIEKQLDEKFNKQLQKSS